MKTDSTAKSSPNVSRRTYTVQEIAKMLCIGKNTAYSLVKEKHFKSVMVGESIRISKKSFDAWLDENEKNGG